MEMKALTKTEQKWFEELKALMKRQPKNIYIYCTPDELNFMHIDHTADENILRGYDSEKVIASVRYRGDAGAW